NLPLHSCYVELEQSAVLNDLPRDLVIAGCEHGQRHFLPRPDLVDQGKIRRGQHPEVLAVLLVNALDVLRDHQLDSCAQLRIGGLFTARSLATPLAADRRDESAPLDLSALYRNCVSALASRLRSCT